MLAEKTGLINIPAIGPIKDSANTSFAKLVAASIADQVKNLEIGYSNAFTS